MMVAANRKRTATALHDGRNHASVPTLYADLQDQTEAQSQTTWERGSQTSISRGRTSHFASSKACVQQIRVRSARRVLGCSGENKDSGRKNGTGGDRTYDVPTAAAWQERLDARLGIQETQPEPREVPELQPASSEGT